MAESHRPRVELRPVLESDIEWFLRNEQDPESHRMAGFTPREKAAFEKHWRSIRERPDAVLRTILRDGAVAGNIVSWRQDDEREIGYWIDRAQWGQGVASAALAAFLQVVAERPLYARVFTSNAGSRRVLEKNGFRLLREEEDDACYLLP